jgi:hypothetical protein
MGFWKKRAEIKKNRIFFNSLAAIAKNRLSNLNTGAIIGYYGSKCRGNLQGTLLDQPSLFRTKPFLIFSILIFYIHLLDVQ